MVAQSVQMIKIFYCYAQEDDALREQLARHLSPLRRLRYITGWFDRDIRAGMDWEQERETHLHTADIILLLISADFFASDYCYTVEMQQSLERHRAGTACVIPILLRPVEWESTPIGKLIALPVNKIPVTQWVDQDKAWLDIVQGIREVIRKLLPKQLLSLEDIDILYPEQGPLSGQTLGNRYLLGELIGEGGFAQVYKARHLQMQRQQAIKVLLERHFRKQEFRDRFLREAQTVASLDHPSIIHLDDFWLEASQAYLVMPFISGGTLQGILQKQQGFLEPDQIVFYLEQICAALEYAHKRGVAHLDLKPQNLLIHEDGRVLLSDFGLAHVMKQGTIEGGSSLRIGTPHYMAPEHIQGSPEKRSDLFSLGVLLYQMLVKQLPFEGLSHETILMKNMTEWPTAPRTLRPELPQAVEDMLGKALAKRPDQRYQTANELLNAFKQSLLYSPYMTMPRYSQNINTPDALLYTQLYNPHMAMHQHPQNINTPDAPYAQPVATPLRVNLPRVNQPSSKNDPDDEAYQLLRQDMKSWGSSPHHSLLIRTHTSQMGKIVYLLEEDDWNRHPEDRKEDADMREITEYTIRNRSIPIAMFRMLKANTTYVVWIDIQRPVFVTTKKKVEIVDLR